MYIITGKGSVSGTDLTSYIIEKCQERGVLFDDDFPEYTLDFKTQIPSVSKSIREGKADEVIQHFNNALSLNESKHTYFMILCLTAHKLIKDINTKLININLWDEIFKIIDNSTEIGYFGTLESLPDTNLCTKFNVHPNHVSIIGDLILSIKRGYTQLGENYVAHPKHIARRLFDYYQSKGISKFFIACTDLHLCKKYLVEFGVEPEKIIDVLEIAGNKIIELKGRKITTKFLDEISDQKTAMRYKYLSASDSLQQEDKRQKLLELLQILPKDLFAKNIINILDIGSSSVNTSTMLIEKFADKQINVKQIDFSEASVKEAKQNYINTNLNINVLFDVGDIRTFQDDMKYDLVLCLGVLLYVTDDFVFEQSVTNIRNLMSEDGVLLIRDALSTEPIPSKIYLAFGGVIRDTDYYDSVFSKIGFDLLYTGDVIIDKPIKRNVRTTMFRKK
jgi:2-polyprenyl-3-methyl-5-hydroxy-6-metoxy-1,4-benzoquinol methylase/aspartate/glutamate racemase